MDVSSQLSFIFPVSVSVCRLDRSAGHHVVAGQVATRRARCPHCPCSSSGQPGAAHDDHALAPPRRGAVACASLVARACRDDEDEHGYNAD